jgi:pimeloyl-ACP methyl ester carboxylesterase
VVDALAPGRPAAVPDRRGRGLSGSLGADYSIDTEVQDLLYWIDLQGQPVDLVGHSYGGLVAAEAVRRGAAVRSLVLYEPVARPFGADVLPRLSSALDRADLDAAVEIINVDLSGYSREHVDGLRSSRGWAKLCALAASSGQELAAVQAFDLDPSAYADLGVPTTLVAGELSRHRPPYGPCVDLFQQALGVDEVVVLPGHDHLAHVTGPVELAAAIQQGLSG